MPNNVVEFILKAQNQATSTINKVTADVGSLNAAATGTTKAFLNAAGGPLMLATAITTAGASVMGLVVGLTHQVESLERVHAATGVAVADVQVVRRVFENTGASVEDADKALGFMARAIGQNSPVLKNMGITTRDVMKAMLEFSEKLKGVTDAGNRAALMQAVFGRSWREGAKAVSELSEQMEHTRGIYAEFGGLLGGDGVKNAEDAARSMHDLSTMVDAVKISLAVGLTPKVREGIEQLSALLKLLHEFGRIPIVGDAVRLFGLVVDHAFDFKHALANVRELLDRLEAIHIYFTKGAAAARAFAEAHNLVEKSEFKGFDGGATGKAGSMGKGGSGAGVVGGKKYETGMVIIGHDVDGEPIWGYLKDKQRGGAGGGAKTSTREKSIDSLMATLKLTRAEAEKTADALDRIEESKKAVETAKKVLEAGPQNVSLDAEVKALGVLAQTTPPPQRRAVKREVGVAPVQVDMAAYKKAMDAVLAAQPKVSEGIIDLGVKWGQAVQSITSSTALLDGGLEALWNGLQNGFASVFQGILKGGMTFKSAMRTLFDALVEEILAMLARIAAAQVFKLLVSFIPGLGGLAKVAGFALSVAPSSGGTESARTAPITVNVSGLDTHDIVRSLTAPRGELRTALASVSLAGAF